MIFVYLDLRETGRRKKRHFKRWKR